jgi:hypothetical protein
MKIEMVGAFISRFVFGVERDIAFCGNRGFGNVDIPLLDLALADIPQARLDVRNDLRLVRQIDDLAVDVQRTARIHHCF